MKLRYTLTWVTLAALSSACGSDDEGKEETETQASQPGEDDDCNGTVTGGPYPGAVGCTVRVNYFANASFAAATPDVTILSVSGSAPMGGISQNLVIRGRPMVQAYEELVLEPQMGLVRLGSVGTLGFDVRGEATLFFEEKGRVVITEVEDNPRSTGAYMLSGSAEWEVRTTDGSETATIAISFVDQW